MDVTAHKTAMNTDHFTYCKTHIWYPCNHCI